MPVSSAVFSGVELRAPGGCGRETPRCYSRGLSSCYSDSIAGRLANASRPNVRETRRRVNRPTATRPPFADDRAPPTAIPVGGRSRNGPGGGGRADVHTIGGANAARPAETGREAKTKRTAATEILTVRRYRSPLSADGGRFARARKRHTRVSSTAAPAVGRGNEAGGRRQKLSITLAIRRRKRPAFAVERKMYVTNKPAGRVARRVLLGMGGGRRRIHFVSSSTVFYHRKT